MNEINFDKKDCWRLGFHLMPITGWLNDPNGLCWFQGHYHVFFQYSPDDPGGGLKHWGHYRSHDLLEWEYLGIALSPEKPYEKDGVYSGSALVDGNMMHLFYTGNVKHKGDFDYITKGREGNTIYVTSKDGIHFSEKQCILTNDDYPKNMTLHIRDPKAWVEEEDGRKEYFMILGARSIEDRGAVLIYKSSDLETWDFCNEVSTGEYTGYMWECPEVFTVGAGEEEKKVLSLSPQGLEACGFDYQNIYQSGYFIYKGDLKNNYNLGCFKEWDRGFDFYAPQSFEDHLGRRILIGWMGMPDTPDHENPTVALGWQHALTIPREIKVKGERLVQQPISELAKLRKERIVWNRQEEMQPCSCYEVMIENHNNYDLRICWGNDLLAYYDADHHVFSLTFTGGKEGLGKGRDTRGVLTKECRKLHIFVDTSTIEIFLNDGEEVFTTRFYPAEGKSSIVVTGKDYSVDIWELNKMKLNSI